MLGLSFSLHATPAWAQDKAGDKPQDKTQDKADDKTEKKGDEEAKEPSPPEDITLKSDGVELVVSYYPGNKGAESVPVILLHGFGKHSRKDFTQDDGLASVLQKKLGCAVVVPDLRGFGESTKPERSGAEKEELEGKKKKADELKNKRSVEQFKKMLQGQVTEMVTEDLRVVKNFLWKKNNQQALNIDKLVVIGVEEGAALAVSLAAYDAVGYEELMEPPPKVGPLKLGQFVKALVLISPVTKFKGSTAQRAMTMPYVRDELSVMIVVGSKGPQYVRVAEPLNNLFKSKRSSEENLKLGSRTLFYLSNIDTPLQGCKLLDEPSLNIASKIVSFVKLRLIANPQAKDWPWKERKHPHE